MIISGKEGESLRQRQQGDVLALAERLVDNPEQLMIYDQAKWNLLGHADPNLRFQGHHPWPKRYDTEGNVRTLSIPVFSGFSADLGTVLIVRKDPWTHPNDPRSWLVAEQRLDNGQYMEPEILSASVDAGNQLWLQLAPKNYHNWPPGYHPALHAPRYDQLRLSSRLDQDYHVDHVEYRAGMTGGAVQYGDIAALEAMIVCVQRRRQAEDEQRLHELSKASTHAAFGRAALRAA